jgi:hypothetical protein
MGQDIERDLPPEASRQDAECLPPDLPTVVGIEDALQQVHPEAPPPPDGGYGWVIVGACAAINCFTWGVTSVTLLFWQTPFHNLLC